MFFKYVFDSLKCMLRLEGGALHEAMKSTLIYERDFFRNLQKHVADVTQLGLCHLYRLTEDFLLSNLEI